MVPGMRLYPPSKWSSWNGICPSSSCITNYWSKGAPLPLLHTLFVLMLSFRSFSDDSQVSHLCFFFSTVRGSLAAVWTQYSTYSDQFGILRRDFIWDMIERYTGTEWLRIYFFNCWSMDPWQCLMKRLGHRDLENSTSTAHQCALQRCYIACARYRHAFQRLSSHSEQVHSVWLHMPCWPCKRAQMKTCSCAHQIKFINVRQQSCCKTCMKQNRSQGFMCWGANWKHSAAMAEYTLIYRSGIMYTVLIASKQGPHDLEKLSATYGLRLWLCYRRQDQEQQAQGFAWSLPCHHSAQTEKGPVTVYICQSTKAASAAAQTPWGSVCHEYRPLAQPARQTQRHIYCMLISFQIQCRWSEVH